MNIKRASWPEEALRRKLLFRPQTLMVDRFYQLHGHIALLAPIDGVNDLLAPEHNGLELFFVQVLVPRS